MKMPPATFFFSEILRLLDIHLWAFGSCSWENCVALPRSRWKCTFFPNGLLASPAHITWKSENPVRQCGKIPGIWNSGFFEFWNLNFLIFPSTSWICELNKKKYLLVQVSKSSSSRTQKSQSFKLQEFYRIAEPGFPIFKWCWRVTQTEVFFDDRLTDIVKPLKLNKKQDASL